VGADPAGRPAPTALSPWAPTELAPGLWRWTAPHPGWSPDAKPDSTGDWDEAVGSLAIELDDGLVFVDALLPADADGFWRWADTRAADRAVFALTTISFHRRSRGAIAARYDASTSRAADALPPGIETKPLHGAGEVALWVQRHGALVFGDRILGDGSGGLRLCPESWLEYLDIGVPELRELIWPLHDLPIERVIVSHGDPVLDGGREALERALS
jgi:hypothetical protein